MRTNRECLKARGLAKGNVETIDKTTKNSKGYLKEIKRNINTLECSSKYKTINRPTRLGVEVIKGKKRTCKGINVILDTSVLFI